MFLGIQTNAQLVSNVEKWKFPFLRIMHGFDFSQYVGKVLLWGFLTQVQLQANPRPFSQALKWTTKYPFWITLLKNIFCCFFRRQVPLVVMGLFLSKISFLEAAGWKLHDFWKHTSTCCHGPYILQHPPLVCLFHIFSPVKVYISEFHIDWNEPCRQGSRCFDKETYNPLQFPASSVETFPHQ